jgi:DNA-binding NarL/FixJ family response regulator
MITIVIAEDHSVVRQGLKLLLSNENDFRLVGEAEDGLEAVHLVEKLTPRILVLDMAIPRLHGLDVLRQIRSHKTRTVVLSMYAEEFYVAQSFRYGAAAYVLKKSSGTELVRAIRKAHQGGRYLGESLSPALMETAWPKSRGKSSGTLDPYETLTNRERTILQLNAEGYSSAEVGKKLFISPRTVETHRANLMRKLNLRSQTDLVRFAIRRKIIPA